MHNTQPWRWRVVGDATIELRADRRRQLQVSDPSGRNLALSCGAVLHHSLVVAQALGLTATVDLMPSGDDDDLLARVGLASGTPSSDAVERLQVLAQRSTDRRRLTSWPIPDARLDHLAQAASGWGAFAFPIIDVAARCRTEELIRRALAVQQEDARYAAEQRAWIAPDAVEGIPSASASPLPGDRPPTRPNRFATADDAAVAVVAHAAGVVESSDGLIAICSAADDQRSWLEAGQALSALWLQTTRDGLTLVPLSQVVEVEETRHALHQEVFDGLACP